MTRLIERSDIVDYVTYEDHRAEVRSSAMAAKAPRRVHVGPHLTFLFENRETLTYQVQEIVRAERVVRESAIQHEIDVYNSILGGPGELGCVLLIEVPDKEERALRLREWYGMQDHIYALLPDGRKVYATYDPGQIDEGKLSAVQYLTFALPDVPVVLGVDFGPLETEAILDDAQRAALANDLRDSLVDA